MSGYQRADDVIDERDRLNAPAAEKGLDTISSLSKLIMLIGMGLAIVGVLITECSSSAVPSYMDTTSVILSVAPIVLTILWLFKAGIKLDHQQMMKFLVILFSFPIAIHFFFLFVMDASLPETTAALNGIAAGLFITFAGEMTLAVMHFLEL